MTTRNIFAAYGALTIIWSLIGYLLTNAPTALIGAAFGFAVVLLAGWQHAVGRWGAASLVGLMLVQAAHRLAVNLTSDPVNRFGAFYFGVLLAVSAAALWGGIAAHRRERAAGQSQTTTAG